MKKYDYDFKISVVEAYKNGLTYQEISELVSRSGRKIRKDVV